MKILYFLTVVVLSLFFSLNAKAEQRTAFGLQFGGSKSENKYIELPDKKLNLSKSLKKPIDVSRGYTHPSYACEQAILSGMGDFPNVYSAFQKKFDLERNFIRNNIGADLSLKGKITGGWYKVNAFQKEIEACFAYYDDKLFFVHLNGKSFSKIEEDLKLLIRKRYGPENIIIGKDVHLIFWNDESILKIFSYPSSYGMAIDFGFLPIYKIYIDHAISAYLNKQSRMIEKHSDSF